jgi:DNA adenine methylase
MSMLTTNVFRSEETINRSKNIIFMPWLGTKVRMLDDLEQRFPRGIHDGSITRYVEPFVGGGSVLFRMLSRALIDRSSSVQEFYAFDNNYILLMLYATIKRSLPPLLKILDRVQAKFNSLPAAGRESFYFATRDRFNAEADTYTPTSLTYDIEPNPRKAALLLFIINTNFGRKLTLTREGKTNASYNRLDYTQNMRPLRFFPERFAKCSELLQYASIGYADFDETDYLMDSRTFCYMDPPYVQTDKHLGITRYGLKTFDLNDHRRLMAFTLRASEQGAQLMISNTGHGTGRQLVEEIYAGLYMSDLQVHRKIGSTAKAKTSQRKMTTSLSELVLTTYPLTTPASIFDIC